MEKHSSSSQTNLTLTRTYHRHGNRTKCFNMYIYTHTHIFNQYCAEKFLVCITRGDVQKREGDGNAGQAQGEDGLAEALGGRQQAGREAGGCRRGARRAEPSRARHFRGSGPGDGMG